MALGSSRAGPHWPEHTNSVTGLALRHGPSVTKRVKCSSRQLYSDTSAGRGMREGLPPRLAWPAPSTSLSFSKPAQRFRICVDYRKDALGTFGACGEQGDPALAALCPWNPGMKHWRSVIYFLCDLWAGYLTSLFPTIVK